MSYLNMKEGIPGFKKAVISFWFRVPQETVDKVYKDAKDHFAKTMADDAPFIPPPPFNGVIPLVVFGKQETHNGLGAHFEPFGDRIFHVHEFIMGAICAWKDLGVNAAPVSLFKWNHEPKYDYQADPSYIGVDCKPTLDDDGNPTGPPKVRLALNLQMQDRGTYANGSWTSDMSIDNLEHNNWQTDPNATDRLCAGSGPPPYSSASNIVTVKGVPELVYGARPENFRTVPETLSDKSIKEEGGKEVTPDTWHHVLISFDLTNDYKVEGFFDTSGTTPPLPEGETEYHGSVSGAAKLWIALDDKNLTKKELSVYWPKTGGDNDFISINAYGMYTDVAIAGPPITFIGGGYEEITQGVVGVEKGTYSYAASDVLAKPFGIPAFEEFAEKVRKVEMAEFLLFPDVTLDTSAEGNRRLFISAPDKKGFQHPTNFSPITIPIHKFAWGDPAIWEPGADWPAFVPGLDDPSVAPTALRITGDRMTIAAVDFTKCSFNWMMGRNAGTVKGKVEKVGNVKSYWPPEFESPRIKSDNGGGGG